MEAINYILGFAVVISGFALGIILAKIAKEELKQGKKYFILFQTALISIIFTVAILDAQNTIFKIALAVVLVYLILFEYRLNWILSYASFAFIYFFCISDLNILILLSALMFIYGFPTGSLIFSKKKGV